MSIDTKMGNVPPNASEAAAENDSNNNKNDSPPSNMMDVMMDVSTSPEKQNVSGPAQNRAAPNDTSSSNDDQQALADAQEKQDEQQDLVLDQNRSPPNGANSDDGCQETMVAQEEKDEVRPTKKQKQDGLSLMDVSSESNISGGASTANSTEKNDVVQVEPSESDNADKPTDIHPSIAEIIKLEDIPDQVEPLECLTLREMVELEAALQIGDTSSYDDEDGWKPDWGGNLLLFEKEVVINKGYLVDQPNAKPIRLKFCDWVSSNAPGSNGLRGLELLLRFVYNMKDTPDTAKKILAYALRRPAESAEHRLQFIIDSTKRVSYDPAVLQQDGWTIKKADTPDGGEAFHLGRRIVWQKHEAIVIAFTTDETYGGLWKAVYIEDLETFDLEPGELKAAIKRYDNKQKQASKKSRPVVPPSGSTRFSATVNFNVEGIENGIILAVPSSNAAQGVLWPARVRSVVEGTLTASGNVRRNSSKNQISVVFLAPFWNGQHSSSKASNAKDPYALGPLFEFENIEISEYRIQKYPFDTISLEKVESSFRFLGLPKAVFPRYLDAHRLAVALKTYSIQHITNDSSSRSDAQVEASASLLESHKLSVRTPQFPQVALTLPFDYILSKLPHPSDMASMHSNDDETDIEPTIDIGAIIKSMSPPECFGNKPTVSEEGGSSLLTPRDDNKDILQSPDPTFTPACLPSPATTKEVLSSPEKWTINKFASDFLCGLFASCNDDDIAIEGLAHMQKHLTALITKLRQLSEVFGTYSASKRKAEMKTILCQILLIKAAGEENLEYGTLPPGVSKAIVITEWRKTCERIYKRAVGKLSSEGVGNNVTTVITDSRCNGHITQSGSFERPVRIPAAIKGAKYAGAGRDPNVLLITEVEESYLALAECTISKVHKDSYIKRLAARVASIAPNVTEPLTEDSEGEGGEDTMGSRGSYTAAVVGVAACVKAADMVVGGQCVNAFCAVRPPGHHAGQELRSMKAISNGFCLFNGAACAAVYATTPISQGGLGLSRVAIIDFDVHHGNGTQDCLCSTYDPRYLYVSLHAGGAQINGYDDEDEEDEQFRLRLGGKKQDGIFPGRCGDTSPHPGVLNIPLGKRVTAPEVGAAMISQVTPKIEAFSPDLIILSAGFDAHVNDPLGMGGLTAEDFRSVTEVACQMAYKTCSGRILSLLEGGYGVPCCQPRDDLFLPSSINNDERYLHLGIDVMPANMEDDVPFTLRQKLDRCHAEGFIECIQHHVKGFINCNHRK